MNIFQQTFLSRKTSDTEKNQKANNWTI